MSSLLDKENIPDTFAARHIKTPDIQRPVDTLSEYSAKCPYRVELARRRRHKTEYRLL